MKSDEEFLNRIKQDLDKSTEELDELTLARLGAARRRAVEAGSGPATYRLGDILALGRTGKVVLVMAGLLLVASLLVLKSAQPPAQNQLQTLSLMEDMELLGAAEELDFYQDMDFYLWVTDEQDSG
ncbi:MAG: hypothetical protein B6D77_06260 [gamma proteobacterium symbiont of Ctena orbiculata]|nr:MAG: hypothetical protein B6D77_06260 [gamma proteobacterium symbiont of Ctena orbiculata]PVV22962.1 MAG: hypothetical protein B6D78_04140 [gamma proteobacterium symbiont of Ctena orbiculata]